MTNWAMLDFQDANSPIMEEFLIFHDFAMLILIFIISLVGVVMLNMMMSNVINKQLLEMQLLEGLWTILPALVLIQIAAPSLLLLYTLDDASGSYLTLKSIGHQWYWSYEYPNYSLNMAPITLDSYMLGHKDSVGAFRLLDVDNRLVVPYGQNILMLTTSADVLHSWAVPSLGIKSDSCPGRLNQVTLISHRPGLAFGQCSEICGANHSFMPICLEMISSKDYIGWVAEQSINLGD